jgi:hypothetical protein
MQRGGTGRFESATIGDESVRAFVPAPLPPDTSLSSLLRLEMDESPGVPLDDVVEVSNYVAALDHGLERQRASSTAAR